MIAVLDLLGDASFRYPKNEYRYEGYAIEAAAAGNYSHVGLYNPKSSGVCAVIKQLSGTTTTATVLVTTADNSYGAAMDQDGNSFPSDTRLRVGSWGQRLSSCKVVSDTRSLIGTATIRLYPHHSDAGGSYYYHRTRPFVLFPGGAIVVSPTAQNVGISFSVSWNERPFDVEEIRGVAPGIVS